MQPVRRRLGLVRENLRNVNPISLAEPVERESPGAVRARHRHFSASALNAYAECERKWFYRYVCAAVDDPGSAASAYGTAFHLALERFHERYTRPRPAETAAMLHALEGEIETAFAENRAGFPTAVEFEIQLRRARRTARRYVSWLAVEAVRAPFTVIGREVPAQLELEGFAFIGFIDRLDRDDLTGTIGVIDYKTGQIVQNAQEYRDLLEEDGDFQLPFYYWARSAAGDRVTRLILLPLKDAIHDVRPVSLDVGENITIAELERAKRRMIEICRLLDAGEPRSFAATDDPVACTYCAYTLACAQRPPANGERFAR
jgi:RecB family exonuclease